MKRDRLYRGHAVPDYVEKFGLAIAHFALRVRETQNLKHSSGKGTERELSVSSFLKELLPSMYEVVKGEAIDLLGDKTPQMDIMIYDRSKNFPFYNGQDYVVLPAEALLCSMEIKSRLNKTEVEKCAHAAQKVKEIRPGKKKIVGEVGTKTGAFRYYHGIFAYDTDITDKKWAEKELLRLTHAGGEHIDFLYVLGRGLINIGSKTYIPEDEKTGQALVALHFSICNFLERENGRREAAPYFSYATDLNRFWQKL
ncbi:hypothetical protein NKJ51_23805 [Mesorhizobium sp. M0134]|uniref:DUF6602 domain-containing protein n=1 Tax=Mesorhizobium sp. M0134 TaxID=2956889 RepID=UPI003336DE68